MGERIPVFLLLIFSYFLIAVARTADQDRTAFTAIKSEWQNIPSNWVDSSDPCGDDWDGIQCSFGSVISITLVNRNLSGQLPSEIGLLSQLQTLDLSYNKNLIGRLPNEIGNLKKLQVLTLIGCGFNDAIPDTIGNLQRLVQLSLNSNKFYGPIPPSIGRLSRITWLDLSENLLYGPIPISNGTTPGLDMLFNCLHFHFWSNKLSGNIPPQLFSSGMSLKHALFESNQLNGSIPSTLGLVQSLEVVRLDSNLLSGNIPPNISNLGNLRDLFLSNNNLSGPLPNLTGMNSLNYLDMSNNSFDPSDIPLWLSTLQYLTTIVMENTSLKGTIPVSLFSLVQLQTVDLKDNQLSGTLDIGTSISSQLELLDLQNNSIEEFSPQIAVSQVKIILVNNPFCQETGAGKTFCPTAQPNGSSTMPSNNCVGVACSPDQILSPNCICAYPFTGPLIFTAPSFSNVGNKSVSGKLESSLMHFFNSSGLPVDSVHAIFQKKSELQYLYYTLEVFPFGQKVFNQTGISDIVFQFTSQTYKSPPNFGPYRFIPDNYEYYMNGSESPPASGTPSGTSSNIAIIAGAAVGGSFLLVLLLLISAYAFRKNKKGKRETGKNNPFEEWDLHESNNSIPQLKGARCFTFEEIQSCTKNFSLVNNIGSGGYGKVYRGTLPNGQLVAVKRAQKDSMQGGLEFKTEIELLSRVHHKNLVTLVGFCFDQGEQMLVYEYVTNGTLKDALSGKSGIRLDWIRRLKITLGAARGLDYLHVHANPRIIHRDIKSSNILLDERLNARVSDFGLSKPLGDGDKGYITTQVKGTMGYLDPEYYMTQQLTEKSDVYSFGVLMLELMTARRPIERGKYIVKVVSSAIDKTKEVCGLKEILDPAIDLGTTLNDFEKFVDLAMQCVNESSSNRPSMNSVVKEIENMLLLAGSNPNAESASTSSSYNLSKGSSKHPYDEYFDSSVIIPRA
ncbi:leucine-rich repeat receptor protein kinase HPCA1-like [Gastrolobium bilobum]|uniref:leucine-rich repeat receptor protein kinase HPCA1-like n=1 Tax=Gastrolobium bilobum TaxID=150636 RepID=UPI002AAFFB50|nr:leucine-rich repeat receptor protein kinase HPCA1-like [Gastrolobium bilobum]